MRTIFMAIAPIFATMIAVAAHDVQDNGWALHGKLLKERFDTSYWREYWTEDMWHIRCVFIDMNGDGVDEMISITTSEEDRMGDYWKFWREGANRKYQQIYFTGDIYFSCHWYSYYKMAFTNDARLVVGLKMDAGYMDKERRRIVKPTPDCSFTLTSNDKFALHEIKPDLDARFRQEEVVSIERLYPEWYFGFDFKPPKDVPYSVHTQRMPYKLPQGDLRHGGGIGCPKDFAAFVTEYRREVKTRRGTKDSVTIYAVFLDADNDGDGDCYVSSSLETTAGGECSWSLYICNGGLFSKAKEAVFPVTRKELCKLPDTVNAGKTSFCRVIRYDVPPIFVLLNKEGQAQSRVRDAITDHYAHRIEKLSCVEFPE